jgi:catechol 2,3-dioxygenase-like lactoylglutathione lyase family enzyme
MPISVRAMNHVLVPTDNAAEAQEFYRDVLGLESVPLPDTGATFDMYWFRAPDGTEVHCVQRDAGVSGWTKTDFNPTMQPHIAFEVVDYQAVREDLVERGIDFYEAHGEGVLSRKQLFVRDPGGFYLELFQPGRQVDD